MPEIETHLAELRRKRGLTAQRLAAAAGVSRQTIYAIEAGTYVPNTSAALRLARELGVTVEELFTLPEATPDPGLRAEKATLLAGPEPAQTGQPVQLCQVDKKLIASPPSPVPWYFPAADAILESQSEVRLFQTDADFAGRILIAGCDPGISVLSRHTGADLVLAHRNSSQSLALLKEGSVHIAGTHLHDNLAAIERLFPKNAVAVVSFAIWEEGILAARNNPKTVRGVEDLARKDVKLINREKGAGARALLDANLKKLKIDPKQVPGYETIAPGHLQAAWQIHSGAADACIATRAAARLFGLHFIPLVTERYDLVVRRRHLELPRIQNLFDTLSRSNFRRELEGLGGYDAKAAGDRLL
jgi:molybdate-binding protein/DNA-binding XRE family transcriptional regulator